MVDDRCMSKVGRGGRTKKRPHIPWTMILPDLCHIGQSCFYATTFQIDIVKEDRALRNDSQCDATGLNEL